MPRHTRNILLLMTFITIILTVAFSQAFAARIPKIKLSGQLNADVPKVVTVADLEKLKLTTYKSYNPFLKTDEVFTGVLLGDLASHFATPSTNAITLTAIDGYAVTVYKDEWIRFNVLLATRVGGKHIEVKDSGPARIVFASEGISKEDQRKYVRKWVWLIHKIKFSTEEEQGVSKK